MWLIEMGVRTVRKLRFAGSGRRAGGNPGGMATDWLPPVIGPADWSIGLLADRSAGWYFDRH